MVEKATKDLEVIFKGATIILLGSFISKFIMYFYRLIVARWLGPFDYGLVSMGLSVFWLTYGFSKLGLTSGIKRRVSHHVGAETMEKIPSSMMAALSVGVPWSVLLGAAVFLSSDFIAVAFFNQPEMATVIRLFSIAIPFRAIHSLLNSLLKGLRDVKYKVVIENIYLSLSTLLVAVVLIRMGWGVDGAIYAQLAGMITSSVLILLLVEFKVFPFIRKSFGSFRDEFSTIMKFSFPLIFSGMIAKLMTHSDTLLIGFFEASESAGLYNAAYPTASILTVISGAFGAMLFPTVSKLYSSGDKDISVEITSVTLKWIFLATFPVLVFMTIFGSSMLRFFFGEAYVNASYALAILGLAFMIKNLTRHYSSFIKSEDMTALIFKITLAVFVLNILLNILLIPLIGINGAAIATAVAAVLKSVIGATIVYLKFGVNPYRIKNYVPGLFSTLIAGLVVYLGLKSLFDVIPIWTIVPGGLVFTLIYGVLFLRLGGINKHDLDILRKVDKKTGGSLKPIKNIVKRLIK